MEAFVRGEEHRSDNNVEQASTMHRGGGNSVNSPGGLLYHDKRRSYQQPLQLQHTSILVEPGNILRGRIKSLRGKTNSPSDRAMVGCLLKFPSQETRQRDYYGGMDPPSK